MAEQLTAKILESATSLWSEKGYANTTMRELARRVGVGLGRLYEAFPTKEALVLHLYRTLNEEALDHYNRDAPDETELGKNFHRFLLAKLEILRPHRSAMVAVFKEAVDPDSPLNPMGRKSTDVRDKTVSLFADMLRRAGTECEEQARTAARALWVLHLAIILFWLQDRSDGQSRTESLLAKAAELSPLVSMAAAMPGGGELLGIVNGLFEPGEATAAEEVAAPATGREALKTYDVVVIGGGPIGALYASWLKTYRPETSVLILERDPEHGHKIGESTLSGFCKALRSVGIRQEALARLFYPKNGLGFFHLDETVRDLTHAPEYILETFDETFQVERRVLDGLILANARRLGVEVLRGAELAIEKSSLSKEGNVVSYRIGRQDYRVRARILADASGPTGVLGRHFGLFTTEGIPFQTGATWAYFRNVRCLESYDWPHVAQFPRDDYTQHFCFREGWVWYIPLVTWQDAPSANLTSLHARLLAQDGDIPERNELSEQFGCPASDLVSVGLVLRQDRDDQLREDPRAAFELYQKKYPAIGRALAGAEMLENPYGLGHPFSSRMNFRRYAKQVVGDGWLLIGDAAFFVDPLISPGLTGGAAGAFSAVRATLKALDSGDVSRAALAGHEVFAHQLHAALERDNQLVYHSFNHPEALALIQQFQEIDARRHFQDHQTSEYTDEDTNVWGILDPDYQAVQIQLLALMREEEQRVAAEVPVAEQRPRDYERMVGRIQDCLAGRLQEFAELTPYVTQNQESPAGAPR